MRFIIALVLSTTAASADVSDIVETQILPGYSTLAASTQTLAETAAQDCTPPAVRPAFHVAYDAWIAISHIQFGPIETRGLNLAMAYWPDPKDSTGKALSRLIAAEDLIVDNRNQFGEVSAAAQGFGALERLLYDPQSKQEYSCRVVQAISRGLEDKARALVSDWSTFAEVIATAGQAGNLRFQSPKEAERALYTALSTGLEFLEDQRLGRPLGKFDRPRPRRAEARRSGRSLRHIELSLEMLEGLALSLGDGDLPETRANFTNARNRAAGLDDPSLSGVAIPSERFRIEVLQQAIGDIRTAVGQEIGQPLGIAAGFNALDGD